MKNFTQILSDLKAGITGRPTTEHSSFHEVGGAEYAEHIEASARQRGSRQLQQDAWGVEDDEAEQVAAPQAEPASIAPQQTLATVTTPTIPASPTPKPPTPVDIEKAWGRVLAQTPQVASALAAATQAADAYAARFDELRAAFDAEQTLREAKQIMAAARTSAEIADASRKMAVVESPSFRAASAQAQAILKHEFDVVLSAVAALLEAAHAPAAEMAREAVMAEEKFFSSFGLPREETAVSRRIRQFAAKLRAGQQGMLQPQIRDSVAPRRSLDHLLAIFADV